MPRPCEAPKATCKCVVWDLDHTLWKACSSRMAPKGSRLRDGIIDVVKELDRRGILQSVASKNNREDVIAALERLGLPSTSFTRRSTGSQRAHRSGAIAQALNIGIDTLMFVDDQEFERRGSCSAWPQVRVVDAHDALGMPEQPECQVPVTDESGTRRLMYRAAGAARCASAGATMATTLPSSGRAGYGSSSLRFANRTSRACLRTRPAHQPDELLR